MTPAAGGFSVEQATSATKFPLNLRKGWVVAAVNATLMTSAIAMTVALPLGLGVAIYLSEYASSRARSFLKPALEVGSTH